MAATIKKIQAPNHEAAVLLVSAELEEVTALADRLLVIYKGRFVGEVDPKTVSNEEIGLMMTGGRRDFSSRSYLAAGQYAVAVDAEHVEDRRADALGRAGDERDTAAEVRHRASRARARCGPAVAAAVSR